MTKYTFSIDQVNNQYIKISVIFETKNDQTTLQLAAWRPGRYELGNFAKNIKNLKVFDEHKKSIAFQKTSKDTWEIDTANTSSIQVDYHYFAAELNAGSTYLTENLLYVNPVNCCVYTEEQKNNPLTLKLNTSDSWPLACSMEMKDSVLHAVNFDELADSPLMTAPSLHHRNFTSGETNFHIYIHGNIEPQWERILTDFKKFTDKQIEKFTEFPVKEYSYLIHLLPYKSYHGVEHQKSTVITLGPTYEVFGNLYKELLGVSSHELYHTWNVKAIRPIEMYPYNFKQENYSKLGYIYEGITTYMGDLFLFKSGVFDFKAYALEFKNQLQKHFDNTGRFNYSVAQSSFDTWLDGYVPGAPGRKVSIYTEGCLLAFVIDVLILKHSNNKMSLDFIMKNLYFNYALAQKGISEQDFKDELIKIIPSDIIENLFSAYIHGVSPFESIIAESLEYLGLDLGHKPSNAYSAGRLGMKCIPQGSNFIVKSMFPGGPAELGGLQLEDELIAINDHLFNNELDKWLKQFDHEPKRITLIRGGKLHNFTLPEVNRNFYSEYFIEPLKELSNAQKTAFKAWSN